MPHFDPCYRVTGRMNTPISCINGENAKFPELEFFEPMARGFPPADPSLALSVTDVKMYAALNKQAHRTDKYDNSSLIVRRGQEFIIGIVFSQPFDPQNHQVTLEFVVGSNPNQIEGTLITVSLSGDNQANGWKGRVVDSSKTETRVGITPNSDSIIGLFSTYVTVVTYSWKKRTQRDPKTDFYLIFNPWTPSDLVYLATEREREEYVLNDTGIIFNGAVDSMSSRPWNYGQFKRGILEACFFVLDFGKMPLTYRGDVIKLTRKAAAMINSQDDDGVVVGNWGDNFSLGTAPSAWTGSAEILLKYASAGGVPVKFGQCWVFAGVLNTFFRCLGLPSRLITNYNSAHDSMGNLKTVIVLDEDGRLDTRASRDSIWNYHCWNEVFMKRVDLPPALSGWQVLDSTPQETSDGYYRCGPTSVNAIKEGQLSYSFDAHFVFAEVNSDLVIYKADRYGGRKLVDTNTTYIGQHMVTKAIGSNQPEVITGNYKYPEGSAEDKRTMRNAESLGMKRDTLPVVTSPDVKMELLTSQTRGDILLTVDLKNLSNQMRTVSITLTCKIERYTGSTVSVFKTLSQEITLQPSEAKQNVIPIGAEEYKKFDTGRPFLSFILFGYINETARSLTDLSVLSLNTPPLTIEVSGNTSIGGNMYVTVKFTNSLSYNLNSVTLRMEGSGLLPFKTKYYGVIPSGSSIKWIESVTPVLPGKKKLVACLDCTEIREMCGAVEVEIGSAAV